MPDTFESVATRTDDSGGLLASFGTVMQGCQVIRKGLHTIDKVIQVLYLCNGTKATHGKPDGLPHDGPFADAAEILGGYMVIYAADYDEAVEIARSHPHMKHNETILIRQTDASADE